MPKVTLKNNETGELQDFEPIDAKEVLAQKGTVYSVPDATREQIGMDVGLRSGDNKINVPQLQGGDAEMQTGLSVEKYGRAAVVKAQPGKVVTDTQNRPIDDGDKRPGRKPAEPTDNVDEMTVAQLRDHADAKGIDLEGATLKNDILAKVKAAK